MDEALKLEKIDGFFEWKKNSGLSLSLCAFGNEMNFAPLPPPPSTYLLDRNVRSQKWSIQAKKSVNREIYQDFLNFSFAQRSKSEFFLKNVDFCY